MPEAECKVCHANSFIADGTHEGSHVTCNTCEEERELKKLGTKWYLHQVEGSANP